MSFEDWKNQVFKYGGTDENGNTEIITNGDEFPHLSRKARRWIQTQLKKGKNPSILDVYDVAYCDD